MVEQTLSPLPPGPKQLRSIASVTKVRRDVLGFFAELARTYGPISSFTIGPRRSIVISDPDCIRAVLINERANCRKTPGMQRTLSVMGMGLLTSDGDGHVERRRQLLPAFGSSRIESNLEVIERRTRSTSQSWRDATRVNVFTALVPLILSIVGEAMFGAEIESADTRLIDAFRVGPAMFKRGSNPLAGVLDRIPNRTTRAIRKSTGVIRQFAQDVVGERRRNPSNRNDLLSFLLSSCEGRAPLTDVAIRDEIITFMLAGHETTAVAIAWALYLLARHPRAQESVRRECEDVLGDQPMNMNVLQSLEMTRRTIAEALRLYPPVYAFSRLVLRDFKLSRYCVPATSTIYVNTFGLHRDGRLYDAPESFDPGRWSGRNVRDHQNFRFLPFGAGMRSCIGEPFAWMMMLGVLAVLARDWEFRALPAFHVDVEPTITLRPKGGIVLGVFRRERNP